MPCGWEGNHSGHVSHTSVVYPPMGSRPKEGKWAPHLCSPRGAMAFLYLYCTVVGVVCAGVRHVRAATPSSRRALRLVVRCSPIHTGCVRRVNTTPTLTRSTAVAPALSAMRPFDPSLSLKLLDSHHSPACTLHSYLCPPVCFATSRRFCVLFIPSERNATMYTLCIKLNFLIIRPTSMPVGAVNIFAHNGPFWSMSISLQEWRHCFVVCGLSPLLHRIGSVLVVWLRQ